MSSSASKPITGHPMDAAAAANADQLGEPRPSQAQSIETSGGWDAYEVWRRFIKDARARRERQEPN
jgi:hypothetical protein